MFISLSISFDIAFICWAVLLKTITTEKQLIKSLYSVIFNLHLTGTDAISDTF